MTVFILFPFFASFYEVPWFLCQWVTSLFDLAFCTAFCWT